MRNLRKIFALVVACAMAMLTVSAVAFAANTPSITIKSGADSGTTDTTSYTAYEIFKADIKTDPTVATDGSTTNAGVASYYIPVSEAGTALKDLVANLGIFTINTSADGTKYVVTLPSSSTATGESIATALNTTAIKNAALNTYTFEQNGGGGTATSGTVDAGYYLVTSTAGTKLVVQTLSPVTINEKNTLISDKKTASTTNLNVGDSATYYVVVIVPSNIDTSKTITVHDTLPTALSFNDDVKVYDVTTGTGAPTTDSTANQLSALTYTNLGSGMSVVTQSLGDDCTFHITINPATATVAGHTLVFKYSAELTSAADPDGDGYANKEFTSYSDYTTTPSTPTVKTFDFGLTKTFANGAGTETATFEVRTNADDPSTAIAFITDTDVVSGYNAGYVKADSNDTGSARSITVTAGQKVNFNGLAAGTYYLVETGTATGYNMMNAPVVITIAADGTATYTCGDTSATGNNVTSATPADNIAINNQTGTTLPSTGGMGTTLLYIVGSVLAIGAVIGLVVRRRMSVQE